MYDPNKCEHHQSYVNKFVTKRFYDTSKKLLNADYFELIKPALARPLTKYLRFECKSSQRKQFHLLFKTLYAKVKTYNKVKDRNSINLLDPVYNMVKIYGRTLIVGRYYYPVTKVLLEPRYKKFQAIFRDVLNSFNIFYEAKFGASLTRGDFQVMPPIIITKNRNSVHGSIKAEQFKKYYQKKKEKYHTFEETPKSSAKTRRPYSGFSRTQYRSDFCNDDLHERIKGRPYSAPSHIYQHRKIVQSSPGLAAQKKKVRRPYEYDEMMKFSSNIPTTKDQFAKVQVEKKRVKSLTFGDQKLNKNVLEANHTASFGAIIPKPKREFLADDNKKKELRRDHLQSSKILSLGKMFSKSTYKNDFIPQKMLYLRDAETIQRQKQRNFGKRTKPFACLVEDSNHNMFVKKKCREMATIEHKNKNYKRTQWKKVLNGQTRLI